MGNTFVLWMIGFVPQIVIALLLISVAVKVYNCRCGPRWSKRID